MELRPRNIVIAVLVLIAIAAIFLSFFSIEEGDDRPEMILSDVVQEAREGDIGQIDVKGDALTVTTTDGQEFRSREEEGASVVDMLQAEGVPIGGPGGIDVEVERAPHSGWFSYLVSFLPLIVFFAIILFFMRRTTQQRTEPSRSLPAV
jgi:ATP-dependent Zn protease